MLVFTENLMKNHNDKNKSIQNTEQNRKWAAGGGAKEKKNIGIGSIKQQLDKDTLPLFYSQSHTLNTK